MHEEAHKAAEAGRDASSWTDDAKSTVSDVAEAGEQQRAAAIEPDDFLVAELYAAANKKTEQAHTFESSYNWHQALTAMVVIMSTYIAIAVPAVRHFYAGGIASGISRLFVRHGVRVLRNQQRAYALCGWWNLLCAEVEWLIYMLSDGLAEAIHTQPLCMVLGLYALSWIRTQRSLLVHAPSSRRAVLPRRAGPALAATLSRAASRPRGGSSLRWGY